LLSGQQLRDYVATENGCQQQQRDDVPDLHDQLGSVVLCHRDVVCIWLRGWLLLSAAVGRAVGQRRGQRVGHVNHGDGRPDDGERDESPVQALNDAGQRDADAE
jgi:hypothetical protein